MNELLKALGHGEYVAFGLSNGMRVILVRDEASPIVRGTIVVHAGAIDSPDTGIAHYFEHIMFKGTDTIGTTDYQSEKVHLDAIEELYDRLSKTKSPSRRKEIQREINAESVKASKYAVPNDYANLAGKYGGSGLNAATSYDYTRYDYNFSPEYFEHWCRLNSERLLRPVFRLFQSELETVYEEKNMYANRLGNTEQEKINYRKAYPHPYAFPIIGSTEALLNPNLREMKAFYDKYYVADNMAIILTGALPPMADVKELLEETFGRLRQSNGGVKHPSNPAPKPFGFRERMYVRSSTMHAKTALLLWHTVPLGHPDLLPIQVLQEMLNNDSKTGRLDELVLSGRLPNVAAFNSSMREMGSFSIYVMPHPGQQSYSEAERLALDALRDLSRDTPENRNLFRRVVLSLIKTQYFNLEGMKSRHSTLVNLEKEGSNLDNLDREIKRLRTMDYSEVVRVIGTYLGENYLDVRERKGTYPVERIAKPGYEPIPGRTDDAVSVYAKFLSGLVPKKYEIRTENFSRDGRPDFVYPGGKVSLYHTPFGQSGIFTLDILHFRQKKGHPAAELLPAYLDMVGGGGMTSKVLFEKLQDLGATLGFAYREDSFLISLNGYDSRFAEAVRLTAAFLGAPDANPDALRQEQTNYRLNFETQLQTEMSLFSWAFSTVLRGKEVRRSQIFSPDEMLVLTPDDMVRELEETLGYEADVHYSGGLSIEEVKETLSEVWPLSRVQKESDGYGYFVPLVTGEDALYAYPDPHGGSQSLIGSYQGLGALIPEDRRLLDFYAYYLGGYMGSVLFQEVREYRSLAYAVQSYALMPHPAYRPSETAYCALCHQVFSRADKTREALETLAHFVKSSPWSLERLVDAQKSYRGEALTGFPDSVRMNTRRAALLRRSGYDEDPIREKIALSEEDPGTLLGRLTDFHERVIKPTPMVYTLFGNADTLTEEYLNRPVRLLTLEDITKPSTPRV